MSFVRPRILRIWPALLLSCVMVTVCGCATTEFTQLRERPHNPLTDRMNTTAFGLVKYTERTDLFLRQTGYHGAAELKGMILHTQRFLGEDHFHEASHALAELKYLGAEAAKTHDRQLASELYFDSARAAWRYFATPDSGGRQPDPNDPQHRSTAEVYNASAEHLLRNAQIEHKVQLGQSITLPITQRQLHFEIPFASRLLTPDQLGEFEFVSDYELKNLRSRNTTDGLGVPIIAIRRKSEHQIPVEKYYTQGMSFAATLVLCFDDAPTEDARLQIFDSRESDGMLIGDTIMPLETDVSTPLARYLSNKDITLLDTWGYIRPDRAAKVSGLYMVQPYDPDRIPVLMVHGVWSSPMTWMEMFNDLQADPEIRRKYQFWFYLYPTGEPLAFSAAKLRDELQKVRHDCDPYLRNDRLDEMVVVGHSMGGLISQMLTINSGNRLWDTVSKKPVEELHADNEVKSEIRRVFFFESNPSVDRIITIASPYNGSSLANRFTRWLSGSLVWLPAKTYQLSQVIIEQDEKSWWDRISAPRTSLDSLTKESGVLRLIRDTHVPPEVKHHNIVGVIRGKSQADWTDGVVAYRSAHCEEVASEKIVRAAHSSVHRHPDASAEVRRILLEHLQETQRRRFPVIPVNHTVEAVRDYRDTKQLAP
ncbi:MAG TPA: alpha/beta fold hydrolase [Planctomycetaceae bacterium]|nr:alpha/beta fold hydrolase [Planctomycetaceae bacterium]